MRKRLALVTTMIGCVALAGGALPGLTAENGTVVGTVSVPLPPAPCVTLGGTAVDFGTLPFSDPAVPSPAYVTGSPAIRLESCSTAPEVISLRASDVTTSSGARWSDDGSNDPNLCLSGPNIFRTYFATANPFLGAGRIYTAGSVQLPSFAPGSGTNLTLGLKMPCKGSTGAGETASMTFSILAAVA